MATPSTRPKTRKKDNHPKTTTVIQVIVLFWCGVLLTISWAGGAKHANSTFLAGVFTSVLANFGIHASRREEEEAMQRRIKTPPPPPQSRPQ